MNNHLANEASKLRREISEGSLLAFAKTYLMDHLKHIPAKEHYEIYTLLENTLVHRGQKIALGAPRGFGKSELVSMVFVLYCAVFQRERYIVILSATLAQAAEFIQNIRQELEHNKKLLEDFPELGGPPPTPWTKSEIQTPSGVRILSLGVGQHIRGRKYGKHRPSLVVADDVENRLNTSTPESREKLKAWYSQDILKVGTEETNHLFLGTVPHSNCLLAEFLNPELHPTWTKKRFKIIISEPVRQDLWEQCMKICNGLEKYEGVTGIETAKRFYEVNRRVMDEGAQILWPERWTYFDLRVEREENPLAFAAELQCDPLDPRTCIFNPDEYGSWEGQYKTPDILINSHGNELNFYGGCDPSFGKNTDRGDYSSITVVAQDKNGIIYELVSDNARRTADQTIEMILAYHQKYQFDRFAIETNQAQIVIAQELEKRARQRGFMVPVQYVNNKDNKIARIQRLQPLLKCGTIQICRSHQMLIEQMRYFPRGRYDDALDSLELAIQAAEQSQEVTATIIGGDDDWWSDYSRNLGWRF